MNWGIIYSAQSFNTKDITLGLNGVSLQKFKKFKYSFVTLPSQKELDKFKKKSFTVQRVQALSGGNYWGCDTKGGIAKSISEILNDNYKKSYNEIAFNKRLKVYDRSYFKLEF